MDPDETYRIMLQRRSTTVGLCVVGVSLTVVAAIAYVIGELGYVIPLGTSIIGFGMIAIGAIIRFADRMRYMRSMGNAGLLDEE